MSIYTVGIKFNQTTKMYTISEPSGLDIEAASLDEIITALPDLAATAYNLPPGSATGLELFVHIPPPEATGPTGVTGTTGTTGTTGASGAATSAHGPVGADILRR